jgi:N6-adenosine-specific RNA methylase IME4
MDRAADNHYATMSLGEIKAIQVPAAPASVLFLWATQPMLPQALDVMQAWGFSYRSHWIWEKNRIGLGYWSRNVHELLLIGTRGDVPAPLPGARLESIIQAPRGVHSEKPEVFARIIEQMFPAMPKLEMFARAQRPGWDVWGKRITWLGRDTVTTREERRQQRIGRLLEQIQSSARVSGRNRHRPDRCRVRATGDDTRHRSAALCRRCCPVGRRRQPGDRRRGGAARLPLRRRQ